MFGFLSTTIAIAVIAGAIVGGVWVWLTRPERLKPPDVPALRAEGDLHVSQDTALSYPVLKAKDWLGRKLALGRHKSVSADVGEAVDTETQLMKKQAEHVKARQREQNEVQRLAAEGKRIPLESRVEEAEHEANIAKHEADATADRLRKAKAELGFKTGLESDPEEEIEERWRREFNKDLGLQALHDKLLGEWGKKHAGDPEMIQLGADKLQQILTREAQRK